MIGTFAALESPSMMELPLEVVIFGRSSTMSTIQRGVEKVQNARSTHGRNPSTGRDRTRRAWRWFCDYVSRGRLALRGRKQFQPERERTRLEGAQGKSWKAQRVPISRDCRVGRVAPSSECSQSCSMLSRLGVGRRSSCFVVLRRSS